VVLVNRRSRWIVLPAPPAGRQTREGATGHGHALSFVRPSTGGLGGWDGMAGRKGNAELRQRFHNAEIKPPILPHHLPRQAHHGCPVGLWEPIAKQDRSEFRRVRTDNPIPAGVTNLNSKSSNTAYQACSKDIPAIAAISSSTSGPSDRAKARRTAFCSMVAVEKMLVRCVPKSPRYCVAETLAMSRLHRFGSRCISRQRRNAIANARVSPRLE
jgi:hypothetical protein